jgi:deoxyadenosine/deoxycytidine kinase
MHIAVTGNIGAGKTTLTTMLAKHYNWEAQFEDVYYNPYLDDFLHYMTKIQPAKNQQIKLWYICIND